MAHVYDYAGFVQKIPGKSRNPYNEAWRAAARAACGQRSGPSAAPYRIYLIRNMLSDEGYVGVTKRPLYVRWWAHVTRLTDPKRKKQKSALSTAIQEHGRKAFTISTLSEALNETAAYQLEKFWIRELRTLAPGGYNMTDGGRKGYRWSRTVRVKMRNAQLARMSDPQRRERLRKARTRLERQRAELRGRRTRRWKATLVKGTTRVMFA